MRFDPELAEIRFGTGLGAAALPVQDAGALLARLEQRDGAAKSYQISSFDSQIPDILKARKLARQDRQGSATAKEKLRALRREMRARQAAWFGATLARYAANPDGMRERLTRFWADHFTVIGKQAVTRPLAATFSEDAIRPHLTGHFGDMLRAAVTHPMMLAYLDQFQSVGEGSPVAQRRGKGLNENLAREVLELHTLGVGADYSQNDVREFANLLAGFTHDRRARVTYFPRRGSPGAEVILGKSYGGEMPRLEDVHAALDDLATHPATARHIARKLAVHFVSDNPGAGLVQHMEAAFLASGGNLMASYAAMLEHPDAWAISLQKVKQPFDFVASSLRALGTTGKQISALKPRDLQQGIARPMQAMGQAWEQPSGPDGWPEGAAHWITPQGLAARIQWALTIPLALQEELQGALPDPRDFTRTALGGLADEQVLFAAKAAETRWEGVGLVLSAPQFQRR